MTDTADPEKQRREAQLKTTLGPEAIQQLYCFSARALNRFLKYSPVFAKQIPPDATNPTPYLEGGIRDWDLDLSGTRTTVDDTKCQWTLTIADDPTFKSQLVTGSVITPLPNSDPVTIVFTGRMVAQYRDIKTMSDQTRKHFHLDQKATGVSDQRYLCWLISFQPDTFTCSPSNKVCTQVANCYETLFKEDIAALFAVLSTPLEKSEADPQPPVLNAMVTVAIAPSYDAADIDTSNNVLVALRDRKKAATVDRSKYPPAWFQQWRRPSDPIDALFVIDSNSYWAPVLEKIMPAAEALVPDRLRMLIYMTYGPNVYESHKTSPVYPANHEGWAKADSKTADYDWVPGWNGPDLNIPQGQDLGSAAFARDRSFAGQVGMVPVPMWGTVTYQWVPTQGLIRERVYFAPGNDLAGKRLPMQPVDNVVQKDSKWQSCITGRVDFFNNNTFVYLQWHIYMKAREFVDGVCLFDFSKAAISAMHYAYGFGFPTVSNLDSDSFEEDLKKALDHAIYEQFQICIPAGRQVHTSECFHNEAGDLLVPFNLSG